MILGIDPGSAHCGWAVVTPGTGRVIALGTLVSKADPRVNKTTDRARRAAWQAQELHAIAVKHGVTTIIGEAVSIAGGPARYAMALSLGTSWGVLSALAIAIGAELLEVTPKQWQHAIDPEREGSVDYAAIERQLTAFVRDQVAEQLAAIERADRNHAIDGVAIGLFGALRRSESTRIVAGRQQISDGRLEILRDALIDGQLAFANGLIAEIAGDQRVVRDQLPRWETVTDERSRH